VETAENFDDYQQELADYQQAIADTLAWERLGADIGAELDRLAELGKREYQKRRDTVVAIAWAEVTPGMSVEDALREPGTVSRGIYYNPQKDWAHNPLFADVLERVTAMVRVYVENRNGRLRAYRKHQLDEQLYGLSLAILEDVRVMAAWPLEMERREQMRREERDGEPVIVHETVIYEPAGWNKSTAALNLQRASKVAYMSLGVDPGNDEEEEEEGKKTAQPVVIVRAEEWNAL
jgi:hypothetical protein